MSRTGLAVIVAALGSGLFGSVASAQTTVQGQIIIQEVQPTTSAPPQAQVYASPPTDSVYVQPSGPAPQQMTCPADASLRVDEYGRQVCMREVPRHHISGGLLGGGIGLLAGGWLISWISGTVVVVGGAVGCAFSSCPWTAGGASSAFFNWSWVPLIGPFVQMGYTWDNADAGIYAWLAFEGLLQAGGLVMLIFGALGEEVIEYQPVPGYAIRVTPMVTASTQGMLAELRF